MFRALGEWHAQGRVCAYFLPSISYTAAHVELQKHARIFQVAEDHAEQNMWRFLQ